MANERELGGVSGWLMIFENGVRRRDRRQRNLFRGACGRESQRSVRRDPVRRL